MMGKDSKQFIIELDGLKYRLTGDRLEQIDSLENIKEDISYITDMQTAISRTMTVDAAISFVDVIVRKKLHESGEFDSNVTILPHWKKSKDKSTTEVFFTALPAKLASHYSDLSRKHEDNLLVFPLYKVLFNILKQFRLSEPAAVVFRHNRFADVVIGTRSKVYYANRCVGFDMSEDQIEALWESVRADIQSVENENKIKIKKIILINWLDSGGLPNWPADEQCEYYTYEDEEIHFNGEIHSVSFTKAIRKLSGVQSIAKPFDMLHYYSRQWIPYINVFLVGAMFVLGGIYFYFSMKANALERQINQTEKAISNIEIGTVDVVNPEKLKNTVKFVKDLSVYHTAPTFKTVINDLSRGMSSGMIVDVLTVNYESGQMDLKVFGKVKAPFKTAYKGYRDFLMSLKQKGYKVADSRFNTEISSSTFTTRLSRGIK